MDRLVPTLAIRIGLAFTRPIVPYECGVRHMAASQIFRGQAVILIVLFRWIADRTAGATIVIAWLVIILRSPAAIELVAVRLDVGVAIGTVQSVD